MRRVVLVALSVSACLHIAVGQAPLQTTPINSPERVAFEWRSDAADRALEAGLAVSAEGLYRDLLQSPSLTAKELAALKIQLAASLIAQRRFVAAGAVLKEIPAGSQTAVYHLYRAVSAYGTGRNVDQETLIRSLDSVTEAELKAEELPWLYLLRGVRAELMGRSLGARQAFELARSVAVSEMQRAFFDSLILREEILKAPSSEAIAAQVRAQLQRFTGTPAAYPYAKEYAIILNNQGQQEEAIDVIAQELANPRAGYVSQEREQLLLLKGLLYGTDTASGRDALQALVRDGKSREVTGVALQLLARARSDLEQDELTLFLDLMLAEAEPHPLQGQMYYIRSRIALTRAEKMLAAAQTPVERTVAETEARRLFKLAEKDAQLLLEQFPGWSEITNVYRVLAYAALQHRPPQYRAAAAFLIQFRDQSEDLAERQALNRQIGDCYFLNEDYRNAVEFYESAASDESPDGYDGALFLRLVTAQLRGGQIESALQLIDEVNFSESISPADRWRAEWNVVQALQANGRLESALKRVRVLLEGDTSSSVPIALDLRLRWLEVRLSLLAGDQESVKDRVNALLLRVESIPEQALNPSPAEIRLLVTEVLLLKADILIQLGDSAAGMEVLAEIRAGYPESSAAERSYLTEADYHASINEFEVAQGTLLKLSSLYESSDLAPQALFEAGLYCELRGAAYFAEAVRLHQNLIERYPVDPLLFSARLKQGDLLRQMNDFAGAQIIYEDLIRSFPEHPRRYVAELSRADCMLALAKSAEGQLKDVAMALERMIDLPNLPVDFQAEVGYKWGFALLQRDALKEAQEVFMLMAGRFLLDGENATRLGVTGRYWMSRAMLELGSLLEEAGELAEARRVYRKMVAYNLPGRTIAQSRADRLPVVGE